MPAPDNTAFQVNIKSPGGTLLNIYAVDAADLSQKLEELESHAAQIGAIESVFAAVSNAAPISAPPSHQPAGNPPSRPSNSPPSAPPAAGAAPSCAHGPRRYKQGVSKAGKPYKMWACPSSDRNNQCPPEWVND